MDEYKLFKQKVFESLEKFEKRLNEKCQQGWKPLSISTVDDGNIILLQKIDKNIY